MCKPFRGLSGVNDDEEFSFDYKKNLKNYQSLVLKSPLSKREARKEPPSRFDRGLFLRFVLC